MDTFAKVNIKFFYFYLFLILSNIFFQILTNTFLVIKNYFMEILLLIKRQKLELTITYLHVT